MKRLLAAAIALFSLTANAAPIDLNAALTDLNGAALKDDANPIGVLLGIVVSESPRGRVISTSGLKADGRC